MRSNAKHDRAVIVRELDQFLSIHPPQGDISWQVRAVLSYIDEHLFDPTLHVCTVKMRCRIRDNNISCRFKYEVGCSVMEYVEARRLAAAGILLRRGDFSVTEIAQSIGYANLQTFYRAFARCYRCKPTTLMRHAECAEAPLDSS